MQLSMLFNNYLMKLDIKKSFSRHDIKELANVKNSRASDIIKNCWKKI